MADPDSVEGLAAELQVDPGELDFLAGLDKDVRRRLHEALQHAKRQQDEALGDAFEGTIRLVPAPLRGRIRRMLLGGS